MTIKGSQLQNQNSPTNKTQDQATTSNKSKQSTADEVESKYRAMPSNDLTSSLIYFEPYICARSIYIFIINRSRYFKSS